MRPLSLSWQWKYQYRQLWQQQVKCTHVGKVKCQHKLSYCTTHCFVNNGDKNNSNNNNNSIYAVSVKSAMCLNVCTLRLPYPETIFIVSHSQTTLSWILSVNNEFVYGKWCRAKPHPRPEAPPFWQEVKTWLPPFWCLWIIVKRSELHCM